MSGVYNWIDKLEYIQCIDSIDNLDKIIKHLIQVGKIKYTFDYPINEVKDILKKS